MSGLRVVVLCTARPSPGSGRAPPAWLLSSQDFPHQPSTSPLPGSHHLFINLNHSAFNAHLNLDFRHVKSYTRDKWEESIYIFILSISTNVCSHVCCCCFPGPGAGVVMVMTSGGGALGTLLPANLNLQQPITLTFIYIYGMWQIRNFIQMKQRVYKYLMLSYFLLTFCHFNFFHLIWLINLLPIAYVCPMINHS